MRMRPRERSVRGHNLRKRDCWRSHVKFERIDRIYRCAFFFLSSSLSPSSPPARSSTIVQFLKVWIFRDRWSRLPIERRTRTRRRFLSETESPAQRLSNHLQVHGTTRMCVREVRVANGSLARSGRHEGRGVTGWRAASRDTTTTTTTRKTVRFWRYNATMLIIAAALPMPWRALTIDSKWPPPPLPPLRNQMHASVTHNSPY